MNIRAMCARRHRAPRRSIRLDPLPRLLSLMTVVLLASSIVGVAAARAARTSNSQSSTSTTADSKPTPPSVPPGPPTLAEGIDTLGTNDFPATYGGEVISSGDSVTVYSTADGASAFAAALDSNFGPPSAVGYTIQPAAHSWADLQSLTSRIAADTASLASAGVNPTSWGPDAASSTVHIAITDYTPSAVATLDDEYGASWIAVSSSPSTLPGRFADRDTDVPPYYGGDLIWFDDEEDGTQCTSGFAFTGNKSGNIFGLTAGHCEGAAVWTNESARAEVGTISTNYFANNGFDVESYNCDCSGFVWSASSRSGYDEVTGTCNCGVGSAVTLNGAFSGEHPDQVVDEYDYCQEFDDGVTTCNVSETSGEGRACEDGDSGGPAYQREPGNTAHAVGIILGGNSDGTTCYYNDIGPVLTKVNGSILVG
jgi:hypothetical protein